MCKVLLVDDQTDVRETLSGVLVDEGYDVIPVRNESETLLKVTQEEFDYALIDVRLHGEDENDESGISLAMALRTLAPKIRIILLSRFIRAEQIVRAIRYHGVVGYVEKTTQSWTHDVLKALERAKNETKKVELNTPKSITTLHLFLEENKSLMVNTTGEYVSFDRSENNLNINISSYSRKADIARTNGKNLRFQIKDIGKELWTDIFDNHFLVGRAYATATAKSSILALIFAGRDEFLRLPLEFMFSNNDYLVLQHPVTRFVSGVVPKRAPLSPDKLALTNKLRILLIASNTEPPIFGVDREIEDLRKFFESQSFVDVTIIPTEQATYNRVRKEIGKPNYDIIHYAGHGQFEKDSPEQSKLYFWSKENKQGSIEVMSASELKIHLENSQARLLYLSACYGTATADVELLLDDDFLGLADAAVKAGVPSVIGYRWPVSDIGAKNLATKFYESLFEQGNPQVALLNARRDVAGLNRDDPAWLSPIMIHQA
jgi:CHAT domain-containing protein/FixJ family two-component response regulator